MKTHLLAIEVLEKSLEMGEARYGLVHRELAATLNNLAMAKQGALGEDALTIYERAIEIREELQGPNHPSLIPILLNSALLVHQTGEGDRHQSYSYQKRALAISVDNYGENNKMTAHVHRGLGITVSYFLGDAENETDKEHISRKPCFI